MILPLDPASHVGRQHGPFRIRRMHPGAMLGNPADGGFGPLGLIDHADLSPGLKVEMHEHRNDEIISYLREGEMIHRDSSGGTEAVRPDRLMVMNAGSGFSHEETVPGPSNVRMLQIFVRPSQPDLAPGVQFQDLGAVHSIDSWRLLAGPDGSGAPATVRQQVYLHDTRLTVGASVTLPERAGFDVWLYVFSGAVTLNGHVMKAHDAVGMVDTCDIAVTATEASDLVHFLIDRRAPASRAGTLSGR